MRKKFQWGRDKISISEAMEELECSLPDLLYQACMGDISIYVLANAYPDLWEVSSIIGYPDISASIQENFGDDDDPVFAYLSASNQQHPKSVAKLVNKISSVQSGEVKSHDGEIDLSVMTVLTKKHKLANLYDQEITGIVPIATPTLLNAIINPNELDRCTVMIRLSAPAECGFGELGAMVSPPLSLQSAIASNRIYVSKNQLSMLVSGSSTIKSEGSEKSQGESKASWGMSKRTALMLIALLAKRYDYNQSGNDSASAKIRKALTLASYELSDNSIRAALKLATNQYGEILKLTKSDL